MCNTWTFLIYYQYAARRVSIIPSLSFLRTHNSIKKVLITMTTWPVPSSLLFLLSWCNTWPIDTKHRNRVAVLYSLADSCMLSLLVNKGDDDDDKYHARFQSTHERKDAQTDENSARHSFPRPCFVFVYPETLTLKILFHEVPILKYPSHKSIFSLHSRHLVQK